MLSVLMAFKKKTDDLTRFQANQPIRTAFQRWQVCILFLGMSDMYTLKNAPGQEKHIAKRYAFVCCSQQAATLPPVNDDSETRKLNAIVGATIKALAESGAGDEFVGAFAASHRAKVASILGAPEPAADSQDLLSIVTQAVGIALEQAGVGKRKEPMTKRVNVEIAGRRTSLTLNRTVLDQLAKVKGSPHKAKSLIQDLANSAPVNVENRSGWVEARLLGVLALADQDGASAARH